MRRELDHIEQHIFKAIQNKRSYCCYLLCFRPSATDWAIIRDIVSSGYRVYISCDIEVMIFWGKPTLYEKYVRFLHGAWYFDKVEDVPER